MSAAAEPTSDVCDFPSLEAIVEHVGHLLPSQSPLHAFVHHNTLHAFEHRPFEDAVVDAARLYGTEPYPSETVFGEHLRSSRMLPADLDHVVAQAGLGTDPVFPGGPTEHEFMRARLRTTFEIPGEHAVAWKLAETDLVSAYDPGVAAERLARLQAGGRSPELALRPLWLALEQAAPAGGPVPVGPRRRDLLAALGVDPDLWVHPVLIRLCAAYLDQGVAYWPMPERELGFLQAFRHLYTVRTGPVSPWMRGLDHALQRSHAESWDAATTIEWALAQLGYARAQWSVVIERTLLSLRGWAGMMRQFEERPERAPVRVVPSRLLDYLAVQLMLDVFGQRYALQEALGEGATWAELQRHAVALPRSTCSLPLVYEAFVLAQRLEIELEALLKPAHARAWLGCVQRFGSVERRRMWQLAYERRHRVSVLDALLAHQAWVPEVAPEPVFQAAFCIDDREESLRRHLEETFPAVETFGYAGFYGVAMAYQGLQDPRPRPLCPPAVMPRHLVVERSIEPASAEVHRVARRRRGRFAHGARVGSRTLVRGSLFSAVMGAFAMVPVVGRSLFPGLVERWQPSPPLPPRTRLQLTHDPAIHDGETRCGYTVEEMADVVSTGLATMGLVASACKLVVVIGHGSSSLNNPHEAAYDCGATGGGRGGPNARAFAAMANRTDVRACLRARRVDLAPEAWFVGAYHNTCDDSITYYDDDLVPPEMVATYGTAVEALAQACALDAQERCRRFDSARRGIDPSTAMEHVHRRALDIAQPRPECGHATNAVCVVGRRQRTRGLFLDRRAFLVSYDPTRDPKGEILGALLRAVGPVGAGINLEYYFSYVDPSGYGCGSKLPHNIVGLVGVMDGHASDLRTGLPWQMVEFHEPVRLLNIVEAEPAHLLRVLDENPSFAALVRNHWIQLVAWSPQGHAMHVFEGGAFVRYSPESSTLPIVERSAEHTAGSGPLQHLPSAHVKGAWRSPPASP